MGKTHYELLDLSTTAGADEIKRAFRREIAKYHPDKVQHLGTEFQEIAATRAAELTLAYKTLIDPATRADYDARGAASGPPPSAPATQAAPPPPPQPPTVAAPPSAPPNPQPREPAAEPQGPSSAFSHDRAGVQDLVRRATVNRFRQALTAEFPQHDNISLPGFEVTCAAAKPTFWARTLPPRILGRFVARVDAATVAETWTMASRLTKDPQRDVCVVFLMAPMVAPAPELARAINELRRKPTSAAGKVVMVPLNTQTWSAHIPTDAPPVVKALLGRLRSS